MTQEEIQITNLEKKIKDIKRGAITFSICGIVISCCLGIVIGKHIRNEQTVLSPEMEEFVSFYNFFKANYYEEVDERTLLDGLYYGLTESVNEPHTSYTSTVKNKYNDYSTSGIGLGIDTDLYYGEPLVTQVMRNGPASSASIYDKHGNQLSIKGLKKGDILIKGKNTGDADYYEFKSGHYSKWGSILNGEENSELEVVFKRGSEELVAKIVRGFYE